MGSTNAGKQPSPERCWITGGREESDQAFNIPRHPHTHTHKHKHTLRQCTYCNHFHNVVRVGMSQYPGCWSLSLFRDISDNCSCPIVLFGCVCVRVYVTVRLHQQLYTFWPMKADKHHAATGKTTRLFPIIYKGSWKNNNWSSYIITHKEL